jgi:RNA polymerase sigma-70 factor (ECF subfamily)
LETDLPNKTTSVVEHLFRQQSGKMSAILTRIFGFRNEDLVEDILQETFLSAMKTWPMKGQPDNPEAWLMQVAKNKIINEINRQKRHSEKREQVHYEKAGEKIEELFLDHEIRDSQLRVLFACCHPDLAPKAQIMLTLKVLSGFGDKEIGSALFMNPSAVKKGIYRAKQQLSVHQKSMGIPFIPQVKDRFDTVLTIIYLLFNEGHKTSAGEELVDEDLCYEAIRLAHLVAELPDIDQGKVYALMSLMYLTLARFPSRQNTEGEMLDIEFQDRSLWDKELIGAGLQLLKKSRGSKDLSKFHLESTIAATHCTASSIENTDWKTIVFCYDKLLKMEDSFLIKVNRAIAVSNLDGPEKGLTILKEIEEKKTSRKALLYAAIAKLNVELSRFEVARSYYQVAIDHSDNKADILFLAKKIEECDRENLNTN